MCLNAPGSVAGSPEFIELLGTQSGNKCTGQLCHGSRLHQFQPAVDTPQVAHPLHAEPPLLRIQEGEAQHLCVMRVALLQRSEEHTSELQSLAYLVCRLLLEKKKKI